jgi:site-specific DNA recombinase
VSRQGACHGSFVEATAPYGYRYIRRQLDGAPAQYVIDLPQAATVRAIFQWIGMERLSIGEVVRRLGATGIVTDSGKPCRDRSVVWGILQNPAYMGRAAFGQTQARDCLSCIRAPMYPGRATQPYVDRWYGYLDPLFAHWYLLRASNV